MKRIIVLLPLIVAISLPLIANGERYQQELSIHDNDSLHISTDVPAIIVEENRSRDELNVELHGPNASRFRMTVKKNRDTVTVEVKKKRTLGIDLLEVFGTELRISIPKDMILENVEISSVSGSITVDPVIEGKEIFLSTVSGAIKFDALRSEDKIQIASVSGRIEGNQMESGTIIVDNVSGALLLQKVESRDGAVEVNTISGAVSLGTVNAATTEVNSISGKIEVALPSSFDGTLETSTLSGRIVTDLDRISETQTEKRSNTFIVGNGKERISLSSTSGSIHIDN